MDDHLTAQEMEIWRSALKIADLLRYRVSLDVREVSDVSQAEHSVLMHIKEAGASIGQQRLADTMYWSKSRLSRQLTRMQAKGLIQRQLLDDKSMLVMLTTQGRDALEATDAVHTRSVRRNLFEVATEEELTILLRLADRLVREG
ncbi:MarR family winged helix-turn-helix transcriptional regulator [Kribbella sp. NPDC058245]|uniref:MarR family winged helix-turn-helix transcriptional regulator n=1 Tax=Kribbella sp. NPDC058245 TaxID=3346399 RepID=UPI0036E9989D